MALTHTTHKLISDHFSNIPKRIALDATCGRGHDTEFLAKLGFENVIGLDIQGDAITSTAKRLDETRLKNFSLHRLPHQRLTELKIASLDCAMFNFGYLPNSDKSVTTLADTSLVAIQAALELLSPQGIMTLLCYPGHEEGRIETLAIKNWLTQQKQWSFYTVKAKSSNPNAPVLYTLKHR